MSTAMKATRLALLGLFPLGCTLTNPPPDGTRHCTNWVDDVAPVVAQKCAFCHSGDAAAGGYSMYSYRDVLHGGSDDVPNAISGDDGSRLLTVLRRSTERPSPNINDRHAEWWELEPMFRRWIVDCRLDYSDSGVHPKGWASPTNVDFHGKQLRREKYDLARCAHCHGDDFRGGKSKASCYACHADGPTGCTTCHARGARFEPVGGAHRLHLLAPKTGHALQCGECHNTPAQWRDPGHLFTADGSLDELPAEVNFGAAAGRTLHGADAGVPTFNGTGCSNMYCHGDRLGHPSGAAPFNWCGRSTPSETACNAGPDPEATCNRCHGVPPAAPHRQTRDVNQCETCHSQTVTARGTRLELADRSRHINGVIELGRAGGDVCNSCHQSTPVFHAMDGGTDVTALPVGFHDSHTQARHRISAPLGCGSCHVEPTPENINVPGHMDFDGPAPVFAFNAGQQSLSQARGATPAWDRTTATCSNVYCHGGGTAARGDTAPDQQRTPSWTRPNQELVFCGSCHGAPPADPSHGAGDWECFRCHATAINPSFQFIFDADGGTLHVNGVSDVSTR